MSDEVPVPWDAMGGHLFLGPGGLKPGWYRYLFDFAGVLRCALGGGLPAGFECTIMISSGTRLPCTGAGEALRCAILNPMIVSAADMISA